MEHLARRVRGLRGWRRLAAALLAGALIAGAQAPVSWPVVLFLALPVILWLMDGAAGSRAGFVLGWAVGVGYFAASMFWIIDPFLVEADTFGFLAPVALVGLSGGLALFWGLAFAIAPLRWPAGWARAPMLAALWTLAEFARGHVLTGFPWGLPAYAWIETPVMQTAALFGPYMLSFLTLTCGLLIGVARPAAIVSAAALVAAAWGFGAWRLDQPIPPRADPVIVRLVQPNAAQDQKWLPGMEAEFLRRHLALSAAPATPMPDITLWSETAVAAILGQDPALQAAAAAAVGPDGHLVLGIRRFEDRPDGRHWYNSLAVLGPDGAPAALYDKYRLVPFGEYIPLKDFAARLGIPTLTTLTRGGFTPGDGPHLVSTPGIPPFLPLICYEAIFPEGARVPGERPEWLAQITNDAWFGTLSGPYQHLAQARARAIEQGLPLARAANTGISAIIDARGQVMASLGLGVSGHVDAQLPAALPPTPYARLGDNLPVTIIVLILGLTVTVFNGGNSVGRR